MIRVLHYCPHALVGDTGSAIAARGWAAGMAALGCQVRLVVDPSLVRVAPPADVEALPVPHRGRPPWRHPVDPSVWLRDADVLVLHGGWSAHEVAVAATARRHGIPYVVTTHNVYAPAVRARNRWRKALWARLWERPLLAGAAAVHVLTAEEGAELRRWQPDLRVVSVPNGIAVPDGVVWDGGSSGAVVWLGRYDLQVKGLDLLVAAVATLPAAERPVLLLHGPDHRGGRGAVQRLVRRYGVGDRVRVGWPVYGTAKWDLLRRALGFVYPSRLEGIPTAVGEAAGIGVPTVVAPYPFGRLLAERGAAHLADWDAASIAAGLRWLHSAAAPAVGRRAAALVRAEWGWERAAQRWLQEVLPLTPHGGG